MQAWRVLDRGDAHHPHKRQAQRTHLRDEPIGVFRQNTGLLRLGPGVDLHEKIGAASTLISQTGQCLGQLGPVERVDHIEHLDRLAGLVGLQRPDQMQLDAGKARLEIGPTARCLLHAILAENTLSGFQHGRDPFGRLHL